MTTLLAKDPNMRDEDWEKAFFHLLPEAKFNILDSGPQMGPDGWPYLFVEISDKGTDPSLKVIGWLTEKGVGLAVNPQKGMPDYVFTYGMLWNFRERREFISDAEEIKPGQIEIKPGEKFIAGTPHPQYLPDYVRVILRGFFKDQGVENVKALVMSQDSKHFDLTFSLESLKNPPEKEHQGILQSLSWFFPPHYSLMLASEEDLPKFFDL